MKLLDKVPFNRHFMAQKLNNKSIISILNSYSFFFRKFGEKTAKKGTERPNNKEYISILGEKYRSDSYSNITPTILKAVEKKLHFQVSHPLGILRQIIESQFDTTNYEIFNEFSPVVSTVKNFDWLKFPIDHPDRKSTNTYYVNENHVLRTHTSAHQIDAFRRMKKKGFLITADVYRRDEIDKNHYPVFHQMEGVRVWEKTEGRSLVEEIEILESNISYLGIVIENSTFPFYSQQNPLQKNHQKDEIEAISRHLIKTVEKIIGYIYEISRPLHDQLNKDTPLKIRWIESYFPFTSPSWELEIFWEGKWIEICGCGIINHELLKIADIPNRIGWAFGLGLERIAMIFFKIPDIRLFWSNDPRFLKQFSPGKISIFQPYSKYPPCYKDIAFWVNKKEISDKSSLSTIKRRKFCENDFMEIVRNVGGILIEEVKLIDQYTHLETKRKSLCYRINYRSMDRSLTDKEVNKLQERLRSRIAEELDIELR
ncbi:phenylalanine-tRNA ligase [Pneumocystis carinii B80]|uniref:Phenylalanine--tRNA ligase, mitochondrial n=1 Tax=Pneumocystis carinii (strain B80) TaxID=1408658 RepID=A0A0W4ZJA7_PNEC8|nr:phenylalanine-tRNA ligase [Pneumocystis carinii B80]KTW28481.1 phenylalanine-tRNA ligase [Pneumocystis carinii B80]